MSNKYPGMDPNLENPEYWQDFHNSLIAEIRKGINRTLPEGYFAFIEQRLVIQPDDQTRRADIALIRHPRVSPQISSGGVAVLERGAPYGIIDVFQDDVYDWFIEIRTGSKSGRKIVTIIELLNPSNKTAGSQGRREYQQKQREILSSDANLVEIDLLQNGAYTVAVPLEKLPSLDEWDYVISAHRSSIRFRYEFWLNRLSEPLPEIQIPLLPADEDIILNLQEVYQEAYIAGRYADAIEDSEPFPGESDPK